MTLEEFISKTYKPKPTPPLAVAECGTEFAPVISDEEIICNAKGPVGKALRAMIADSKARQKEIVSRKISFEAAAPQEFHTEQTFVETLFKYIDQKGMTDVECYQKAYIDRRLFSKMRSDYNYKPTKKTALAFAIALELDIHETNDLLRRAGYTLSPSLLFDVVVEYFIREGIYDIYKIDDALAERDLPLFAA